ncbi:hypothetical protein BRAS3843_2770084 [Bradyrhizobium sp. STM 3843]|nr:hypothetical protein BRAS3843_2770084 [Bradyrhizobium sp. STM 3843]
MTHDRASRCNQCGVMLTSVALAFTYRSATHVARRVDAVFRSWFAPVCMLTARVRDI